MGLDFFTRIDCEIQRGRDSMDFIHRAKVGEYAEVITHMVQNEPDPEARERMTASISMPFPVPMLTGSRAELSYDELMEAWSRIDAKSAPHCRDCPLNYKKRSLGCAGALSYPFSEAFEFWLLERFDPASKTVNAPDVEGYLLFHIKDARIDGRRLDSSRGNHYDPANGNIPLVIAPRPAEKWFGKDRITSSMLIEYLLGCAPILHPQTAFALVDELGAIEAPLDARLGVMMEAMTGKSFDQFEKTRFTLESSPSDDRSVSQFKRFLYVCFLSLKHRAKLFIDG